jgi:hypothetical protein
VALPTASTETSAASWSPKRRSRAIRLELGALCRKALCHLVEAFDELPHLGRSAAGHPNRQVAGGDRRHPAREAPQRRHQVN